MECYTTDEYRPIRQGAPTWCNSKIEADLNSDSLWQSPSKDKQWCPLPASITAISLKLRSPSAPRCVRKTEQRSMVRHISHPTSQQRTNTCALCAPAKVQTDAFALKNYFQTATFINGMTSQDAFARLGYPREGEHVQTLVKSLCGLFHCMDSPASSLNDHASASLCPGFKSAHHNLEIYSSTQPTSIIKRAPGPNTLLTLKLPTAPSVFSTLFSPGVFPPPADMSL